MQELNPTAETKVRDNVLVACSAVFILLVIFTIVFLNFSLPIQTDEVAWSSNNHRSIIDNYTMILHYPQCGNSSFSKPLPWLWYIPAWIDHLIYYFVDHPIDFRVLGLFRLCAWFLLWMAIFKHFFSLKLPDLIVLSAIILAAFTLDSEFILLLLARPDQSMLLSSSIAVALAVYAPSLASRPTWARMLGALFFVVTTLQLGQGHPRAIVFLPLFAVTGFIFAKRVFNPRFGYLFFGVISAILIYSYTVWLERYECHDLEYSKVYYARTEGHFFAFNVSVQEFLTEIIKNLASALRQDFCCADIHVYRNWLHVSSRAGIASAFATELLRIVALFATVKYSIRIFCARFKNPNSLLLLQSNCNILALCVLLALFGLMAFQGNARMFYFGALEVPLLYLAAILTFGVYIQEWRKHKNTLFLVLLISTLSLIAALGRYGQSQESVGGNRVFSFSLKHYTDRLPGLEELAKQCGINVSSAKHLVVDDITYLPFRQSFQPYHIFYATGQIADDAKLVSRFDVPRFMNFLEHNQSSGIITDCRDVLDPMLPYAIKRDGFCCIPPEMIHKLALQSSHN